MTTITTPDAALLWARKEVALAYAGEASARFVAEMAAGGNDNWAVLVTAEAFRAGQAHADAGLLAALERSTEGWANALELGLIPERHRNTAEILAEQGRAAITAAKGTDYAEG